MVYLLMMFSKHILQPELIWICIMRRLVLVYGQSSGRPIEPDYPSSGLDIQPKIDEFRIVGSTGESVGISSIKAGDGVTATTTITVTLIVLFLD